MDDISVKLITIHETESTLEAVDNLVRQRVFNSRAEVYRTGALLMVTIDSARRLAKADRLDEELYSREVRRVTRLLHRGEFQAAQEGLTGVEDGLRLKAILNRVGGRDAEGTETLADGFHRNGRTLARAAEMEPGVRRPVVRDLSRDLGRC